MRVKAQKTSIDCYDGSRRQSWVMPVIDEHDQWQNITDVPCPRPGCEGVVVWYEAGYVPGYRVCTHCRHHFEMGRDEQDRLVLIQNGRTGVFAEHRQGFRDFMRFPRPTTILDLRVPLPPDRSASVPQHIVDRVATLLAERNSCSDERVAEIDGDILYLLTPWTERAQAAS